MGFELQLFPAVITNPGFTIGGKVAKVVLRGSLMRLAEMGPILLNPGVDVLRSHIPRGGMLL